MATGADQIAVAGPFCRVILTHGDVPARRRLCTESVEVVEVAQVPLAAVRRGTPA